jgi:hypothetical protein
MIMDRGGGQYTDAKVLAVVSRVVIEELHGKGPIVRARGAVGALCRVAPELDKVRPRGVGSMEVLLELDQGRLPLQSRCGRNSAPTEVAVGVATALENAAHGTGATIKQWTATEPGCGLAFTELQKAMVANRL